jgi:hypothetical protein
MNTRTICIAASLATLTACDHGSNGGSSGPAPSATPSASAPAASAAPAAPVDKRPPITEFDLSGDVNLHMRLVGPEDARLDAKHVITFTFSQLNEATDAGQRQVFSLQGGGYTEPGKTQDLRGNMMLESVFYTGQCKVVTDTEGPAVGPKHTRWREGTFSCEQLQGSADKKTRTLKLDHGHFAGPFDDHRDE